MRKWCVLFLMLFPSIVFADSATDALKSLRKLETRCQVGISYKDYSLAFADAKFETRLYLESKSAKQNPELAKLISNIADDYDSVNAIWGYKIKNYPIGYIFKDSDMYNILFETYPDANKQVKNGGVLESQYNKELCDEDLRFRQRIKSTSALPIYCFDDGVYKISITKMIDFIWSKASIRLKQSITMMDDNKLVKP